MNDMSSPRSPDNTKRTPSPKSTGQHDTTGSTAQDEQPVNTQIPYVCRPRRPFSQAPKAAKPLGWWPIAQRFGDKEMNCDYCVLMLVVFLGR
jgi:hypothetical protein